LVHFYLFHDVELPIISIVSNMMNKMIAWKVYVEN